MGRKESMNVEGPEAARLSRRELLERGGQALAVSGLAAQAGGSSAAALGQPGGPPPQPSSPREASGMKVYFDNPLFDAQLLRALAHAYYDGADVGECLSTA